jgi:tetratricopeptide (TPR) repeat protein
MEKISWMEEYLEEGLRLAAEEGHEPALNLLEKLLYDEPGYARLHHTLGIVHFYHADNPENAEKHLRLAIQFDETFAEPYWYLGKLLSDDDRLDEAIEVYQRGMKAKRARKAELSSETGRAYELKKKFSAAIRHYKKALGHSAELWNCLVIEQSIKRCKRKQKN